MFLHLCLPPSTIPLYSIILKSPAFPSTESLITIFSRPHYFLQYLLPCIPTRSIVSLVCRRNIGTWILDSRSLHQNHVEGRVATRISPQYEEPPVLANQGLSDHTSLLSPTTRAARWFIQTTSPTAPKPRVLSSKRSLKEKIPPSSLDTLRT